MSVDRLGRILIGVGSSIREAMQGIDDGGCEIALATDAGGVLLGTLTDGDIRRALLDGASLDDPVKPYLATNPFVVGSETPRAEVLDLMNAHAIHQVPVVDEHGVVTGLHLVRDLLGRAERENWAAVMAGGRGLRLGNLTRDLPKPMLPVAGRPILERIVLHLVGSGIRTIVLCVGYQADRVKEHFADGARFGCRILYVEDGPNGPLGTGGPLRVVLDRCDDLPDLPLLVMNGDLLVQCELGHLFEYHSRTGADATVAAREHHAEVPFGVLKLAGNRVTGVLEKPVTSCTISAGIYLLERKLLERISPGRPFDIPQLLEDCISRGDSVMAWGFEDDWHDIGHPDELRRARGED